MPASATEHVWMTRLARRSPSSSGLPLPPAKAAPCVLDLLGQSRHQTHSATKAGI